MFPSYRSQSADLQANQLTGFYMMGTLVVKWLSTYDTLLSDELFALVRDNITKKTNMRDGIPPKVELATIYKL